MLLSSHGHWHLVQKHWLPRRRRARPSAALDDLERIIAQSAAKRKSISHCGHDLIELVGSPPPVMSTSMPNPWLSRRLLNYAHQGGAKEAPSSTMHAFRSAVANGADALEMDVHATSDGHLVVCHDATVDRTTDARGRIADMTLEQLGPLDNAYWFVPGIECSFDAQPHEYTLRGRAPRDHDFGIATLREVLESFPDVFLNLDIKETYPQGPGYEDLVANLLHEFGRTDDVIVASFHDVALERFHAIAPNVHTSLGPSDTTELWRFVNQGAERPTFGPHQVAVQPPEKMAGLTVVDPRFVEGAHDLGLAVHVWTIDDAAGMIRQLQSGVDGIITNTPQILTQVLRASRS